MQATKILIALSIAAGFATASFAQGNAPTTPATPAAKVSAPAPASAEKKLEAPKAAEPAKADASKSEAPKMEAKPKAKKARKAAAVKPADTTPTAANPAPTSK